MIFALASTQCGCALLFGSAFTNLDFESASITGAPPQSYELPTSQAMPGWTTNNFDVACVGYDGLSTGATAVSLQDGLYAPGSLFVHPVQGSYSALLQYEMGYPGAQPAWISQTGDVPSYANSLLFETDANYGGENGWLTVSLNGTTLPMSLYAVGRVVDSSLGPVETFVGDVRAFTGQQNVALCFTGIGVVDSIQFSSIVVPEPCSLVLLASVLVAAGTACARCWRHPARRPLCSARHGRRDPDPR
jgi:hypothetical protein